METILLLEAAARHAEMMREHLEKRAFQVLVSPSAAEARDILEKRTPTPDILVIDLNIADQGFLGFYHWLVNTPQLSKIPRLFIAGKMQSEIAQKLEKEFKETILNKPLDINRFMSTFDELKSKASPLIRKNRQQDYFSSLIGQKIGPATIREEIGRGGMGAVFLAYQESLDRSVAIKVLLPEMVGDFTAIERFQREALAIAKLKSPHIVQIFDFGEYDNNAFYISMEYLAGQTVDHYLKRNGSFPMEKAISVIIQVATGLSVAHDAGLIHRDIKPSNLIMDNRGHVTITDFGLVRPQKKVQHTRTGVIVGSPHYMAPEQLSETPLDARSDIYSLGIVFFHLIAGHPPFLAANPMEILVKHLNEPLPDLRKTIPGIPPAIIHILERMTAKDPNERYINCRELIWDLNAQQRKFSGTATMPMGMGAEPEEEGAAPGDFKKVSIDTDFHPVFTELKKQFPTIFNQENLLGSMTLSESGNIVSSQGKFPEEWRNILYVLQESAKQLNAAVKLGRWKFKLVETPEQVLAIFPLPKGPNLGTLLFSHKDSGTFSSTSLKNAGATFDSARRSASRDPVRHISSIAGVIDVMLLNMEGETIQHSLKDERMLDLYKRRFAPVAQIIQSISIPIAGVDIWFDRGRILAWVLETGILFVIASLDISRSFLSIYITAHLQELNATTQTAIVVETDQAKKGIKAVENPISPELMEHIQLELARTIGPIAKVILSRECKMMGYSRGNFPLERLNTLIRNVSQRIDESRREQFSENVQDIIYEFEKKSKRSKQ